MLIFWAVLGGFLLDAVFGDPVWLPHPVVLMGRCITALEKRLHCGGGAAAGYTGCDRAFLLGCSKNPSAAGAGAANVLVRPGAGGA